MNELEFVEAQSYALNSSELRQRLDAFESDYLAQSDSSPNTAGTYKRSLTEFIRWVESRRGGEIILDESSVTAYRAYLTKTKQLAPASVVAYVRALKHYCDYLVRYRLIETNPLANISLVPQPPSQSREILTRREVERLMATSDTATELGARDYALVACMLYGGLNEVQLIQANVKDIAMTHWGWQLQMNTARDRGVPLITLDRVAESALEQYLGLRHNLRMADPLFISHGRRGHGQRLTTRTIRNRIKSVLNKAGIDRPGITPKSLNLTSALLWIKKGISREEIRQRVSEYTLRARLTVYKERGLLRDETLW